MKIDTQKLLSLFDTAAQAHGWASDQGTRAQAQTALANYQRTRGDLEQALDAQTAKIAEAESQTDRYRRASERWKKVAESAEGRVRDQAAEIARLRDAAKMLADWAEHEVGAEPDLTPGLAEIRAALAQKQGGIDGNQV